MYAAERHEQIVGRARTEGRVEVRDLARSLHVTPETVRRDLADLARLGVVRRVHGGAIPVDHDVPRAPAPPSDGPLAARRERIARRALEELAGVGSVALAGGPTTLWLARVLPEDLEITVLTPALEVAELLAVRPALTLHLLGGLVRPRTSGAVGDWIARCLSEVAVDVAVLDAHGLTAARGLTASDLAEATVQRRLIGAAARTVVLAEGAVVGRDAFAHVAPPTALDLVVTDTEAGDEHLTEIEHAGASVVRA